jgi:hypothetical protein
MNLRTGLKAAIEYTYRVRAGRITANHISFLPFEKSRKVLYG